MNSGQPTFTVLVTGANSANRCATGPLKAGNRVEDEKSDLGSHSSY